MSKKTLPLLFINLGGEMLYILDQRLKAQSISKDKATRVLHDITSTMFNKKFVEELFKPQDVYSKRALRTVFDRLAHASIMRLNTASMDKLYDLMTMAFKYQVSLSLRPQEILLVTLSHMDSIKEFVKDSAPIRALVDDVYGLLGRTYANLSPGEFMLIRQTLLGFFQDMHIRVSIFLRDKKQLPNGRFVLPTSGALPYGTEVPGTIRIFDAKGKLIQNKQFNTGGSYQESKRQGSFDIQGDRQTALGRNMYSGAKPSETNVGEGTPKKVLVDPDAPPDPKAKAQLDYLASLLGSGTKASSEFRINLFSTDREEEDAQETQVTTYKEQPGPQVLTIDASQQKANAELARILGQLTLESATGSQGDDDLLSLMDKAS